jgi:hypothetical protein
LASLSDEELQHGGEQTAAPACRIELPEEAEDEGVPARIPSGRRHRGAPLPRRRMRGAEAKLGGHGAGVGGEQGRPDGGPHEGGVGRLLSHSGGGLRRRQRRRGGGVLEWKRRPTTGSESPPWPTSDPSSRRIELSPARRRGSPHPARGSMAGRRRGCGGEPRRRPAATEVLYVGAEAGGRWGGAAAAGHMVGPSPSRKPSIRARTKGVFGSLL